MAVRRVLVAPRVERQAERVDLSPRDLFDARSVFAKTKRVSAVHRDLTPVGSANVRRVPESMAGVDPTVDPPREGIGHPVRVDVAESPVQHVARLGSSVAVGVAADPDVRDAEDDRSLRRGRIADRDVQSVEKVSHLRRFPVHTDPGKDGQPVARRRIAHPGKPLVARFHAFPGDRIGILDGMRDPQPAGRVEGDVHRLPDVRLRGHELDLESGRKMEPFPLLLRTKRVGLDDQRRSRRIRSAKKHEAQKTRRCVGEHLHYVRQVRSPRRRRSTKARRRRGQVNPRRSNPPAPPVCRARLRRGLCRLVSRTRRRPT